MTKRRKDLPASVADWPDDAREDYEERAAIIEYDGRRNRADAERMAEKMVREKHKRVED